MCQGCVISYHLSALGGQDLESERCKAQSQSNVSQMSVKCLESNPKQSNIESNSTTIVLPGLTFCKCRNSNHPNNFDRCK